MADCGRDFFKITKIDSISCFDLSKNQTDLSFSHKWVMIFFKSGGKHFFVNNKKYIVHDSCVYFFPFEKVNIRTDLNVETTGKMYVISMNIKLYKECNFQCEIYSPKYNYLITFIEREIKKAFSFKNGNTITDFSVKDSYFLGAAQVISIYIEQYLISFLEKNQYKANYLKLGTNNNNLIVEINKYLEDNITKSLKNEEISRKFNYSISSINNQFKKYFGRTLHEQVVFLKIEKAKNMLRKEYLPLNRVSDILCFSTPESFSKVFKKVTGITPNEYIKNIKTD